MDSIGMILQTFGLFVLVGIVWTVVSYHIKRRMLLKMIVERGVRQDHAEIFISVMVTKGAIIRAKKDKVGGFCDAVANGYKAARADMLKKNSVSE